MSRLLCVAVLVLAAAPVRGADPEDPQIKALIDRGIDVLKRKAGGNLSGGYDSLSGYALLKAGVSADDPAIRNVLAGVEARFAGGAYRPKSHGHYEAGCDLMFLEALHDERYKPAMSAIVQYIAAGRLGSGAWTYVGSSEGNGDQSITQYVVLGLWAAERAEVPVPPQLWDGIAAWQVQFQQVDGGFGYHPKAGGNESRPTMTVAGITNLYVCQKYLFGKIEEQKQEKMKKEKPERKPRFGILQRVEAEEVAEAPDEAKPQEVEVVPSNYRPRTPVAAVRGSLNRSTTVFGAAFPGLQLKNEGHPFYLFYGIERMAALAGVDKIGGVDWYDAGVDYIVRRTDWVESTEKAAFVVLFLTKATSKILGRKPKPAGIEVGSGLLAGGRGLPEDLSQVVAVSDGQATVRKSDEPLDELFAALGDPSTGETIAAQQAIVEKLRLGDREELIGQIDKVLEFVEHPHYEIRRTGIWVLGRTEDLQYVDELVEALLDENLDVAVEARNALCFVSRKPRGLGMSDDPFAAAAEGASDEQRTSASKAWQKEANARWSKWAAEKRPYEARDRVSLLPDPDED